MKRMLLILLLLSAGLVLLFSGCGRSLPPDDGSPEPPPLSGVFVSPHGTLTFDGDGETVCFSFDEALADAAGLPAGDADGSYVFLFHGGLWRYDFAESFRLSCGEESYLFPNVHGKTNENTVVLVSPVENETELIFTKEVPKT